MGLRDKIANTDFNQLRDKMLEKASEIDSDKIKETASKASLEIKSKVSNIDTEKINTEIKEGTEFAKTKAKEAITAINISSLRTTLSEIQFDTLKEKLPKLDSNDAKAYAIIAVCVGTSAGFGALTAESSKKGSSALVKLQKAMIIAIGNTYAMDVNFITEVNDVILNKFDITSKVGKSFVAKLSNISIFEDQKPALDAIVAGTVTFITGELSKVLFEKVKDGEIDISQSDIFTTISSIYDGVGPKQLKKVFDALNKKDPEKVLENLVDILSTKLENETEQKDK